MFAKILDTRYEFLNSYGEGELVSRIENTGDKIVSFYIDLFSSIVMIMFSIIISAYIMIRISLKLFIIAIILLPLTYGINYIFKSTIISKQRYYITKLDAYSDYLVDTISNLTGIKLNNLEKTFKRNYKNKLQDLKNVSVSNLKINMTVTSLQDLITIILSSLILFISAKLIILGNLTLGNIVAFSSYMEKLHSSIKNIGDLNLSFNEVIVDLERYKKIMDHDSEKKIDGKKLSKVTSLKFKNVSFKYDDEYILKDFSFEISKPGLYAIVGENGSGKTTIFNLISKLYTNYEGEILINGNEISDHKDVDLRNEVLFIESKPFILRDNLASNITLLEKKKVDEPYLEKIIQFLELERIEKYSTKNLKDTLSKGEQQKIQLARMMIGRYSLILLDEVLSGLDQEIKKKAISKIKEKSGENIVVIITHEQEIQRVCDDIFLMYAKKNSK